MRAIALPLCWAVAACAPPPEVVLTGGGDTGASEPTIEIVYPQSGQQIALDCDGNYVDQIIVEVENFELDHTLIDQDPVGGVGHWHGGPDLLANYCLSGFVFCEAGDQANTVGQFDGTGLGPGRITLQAQLQTNDHQPVGELAQVEVDLVEPPPEDCP